jgi:BTB/POZ domain-containing protein 8
VLPVTLNHGLDDLYRKCLKWVCKHFNKVWLTRQFSQLPSDVHQRCRQQISAHLTSENVLNWIQECEELLKSLEQCRWNIINVDNLVRDILDSAHCYVMDHFASLIASDSFLSLGHGDTFTISRFENLLLRTAAALTPEQACRSYPRAVRLNQLLTAKVILPNPLSNESLQIMDRVHSIQLRQEDQDGWNEEFIGLVSALLSAIEQCLIRQCSRAMRCSSWQRMDGDLRSKMQKLACLTEPDEIRRLRSSASSVSSMRNYSASSSVSSRTNDLRQVKLAIQAHSRKLQGGSAESSSNIPVIKKTAPRPPQHVSQNHQANSHHPVTKSSTRTHVPEKPKLQTHRRSHSEDTSTASVASKAKLTTIKSRYMDPKKPKTPVLETRATNRLQIKVKHMSSSESSTRGSSPAFNRRQNINVRKSSNLSLDSLQSPTKQRLQLALKAKNENLELSIDSLVDSMRSSLITEKTVSSESLVRKGRNLTDETKLMKCDSRTKIQDNNKTASSKQTSQQNNQIRRSFLSQKSREILAKSRKHSTNSNSSVTTKSTNPSPRTSEINKSSSSASLDAKKKVYSTTLHLRKSAKLPDPKVVAKEVKKTPVASKIASNIKAVSSASKQLKPNPQRKSSSSSKIVPPKKADQQVSLAPIAKHEEDEISMKMARSNTFSKETSDNPLELLEIIN